MNVIVVLAVTTSSTQYSLASIFQKSEKLAGGVIFNCFGATKLSATLFLDYLNEVILGQLPSVKEENSHLW